MAWRPILYVIFTTNPRLTLDAPYFKGNYSRSGNSFNGYIPIGSFLAVGLFWPCMNAQNQVTTATGGCNLKSITHEGGFPIRFQYSSSRLFCFFKKNAGLLGYGQPDILDALKRLYKPSNYPEYRTTNNNYFFKGGYKNNFYMVDYGQQELIDYFAVYCNTPAIRKILAEYKIVASGNIERISASGEIFPENTRILYEFITDTCLTDGALDLNARFNLNRTLTSSYYNSIVLSETCFYDFYNYGSYKARVSCNGGAFTELPVPPGRTYLPIMLSSGNEECITTQFLTYPSDSPGATREVLTSYASLNLLSDKQTTGTVGLNRINGYAQFPFQPLFFDIKLFDRTVQMRPPQSSGIRTLMGYITTNTGAVVSQTTPLYLLSRNGYGMFRDMNWIAVTNVYTCLECVNIESNTCYWDQLYYSEVTWKGTFVCPPPDIYIQVPKSTRQTLLSYRVPDKSRLFIYIHQTLYIQNYTVNPRPIVNWYLPECVSVTSRSIVLDFCTTKANYICQYDYTKYAVVAGTQCDVCMPSTSTGGVPIPGITCLEDNALANSELYPYQHLIKRNYQLGTLSEFAASVNIDPDMFNFENVTLIVGYARAWEKWEDCYCSRAGQTSINVNPELNWSCFCLKTTWPVNCGRQVDPRTNSIKRFCATKTEYCNIYLNDTEVEGPIMRTQDIPPILRPVDPSLSYIDPTCGYNLELYRYDIMDKFGGPQTDLMLYQKILSVNDAYIQLQASPQIPRWYNGGKTPINFKFEWNITVTVSGYYKVELCSSCTGAFMEIIVYPLNLEYSFPILYVSENITLETTGSLTSYSVNITVTESDTGTYEVEGELFPLRVFKGIGMRIFNLDVGSTITIYNPIVSTASTRTECETRELPIWREPSLRIRDSSPDRFCVLTEDEQEIYPGSEIGECHCDASTTGPACDSIATYSKYGKKACGGFGECNSLVLGPDSVYYITSSGDECGTYIPTDLVSNRVYSDCKNINLGRYIFTLWTDNAVLDYPSVYVETIPLKGSSIFKIFEENTAEEDYVAARASCNSQGMFMPYFYTLDELLQLIVETKNILPVFIGVDTPESTPEQWPWENVDNGYFMNEPELEYQAEEGACDPSTCAIVNFNNFAYFADITGTMGSTPSLLQDGNTLIETVASGTYTIVYNQNAELEIKVYLYGVVDILLDPISCSGGVCESWSLVSVTKKMTDCRCPNRILSLEISNSNEISEVQIYNMEDNVYSSSYI